jgi:hypothetical protein
MSAPADPSDNENQPTPLIPEESSSVPATPVERETDL